MYYYICSVKIWHDSKFGNWQIQYIILVAYSSVVLCTSVLGIFPKNLSILTVFYIVYVGGHACIN